MSIRGVALAATIVALAVTSTRPAVAQGADPATGALTVNGKTYALAHAAAFVDGSDSRKPIVLVLTDKALPAKALTTGSALSMERNMNAFSGVAVWLDDKRTIFRAEYYENGEPTATSGLFALKLSSPPGKVLAGTIQATPAAATLKTPIKVDITFSATVK